MTTTYAFHNKLVLRTPRYTLMKTIDKDLVNALMLDQNFLEAIYLASPVLYDECIKFGAGLITNEKEVQKISRSIVKYYSRMCSRCTPFGLFSGCAVVNWSADKTNVVLPGTQYRRHTRFDMHYLCALAQEIALLPAIKEKLLYKPNTSMYKIGDEIRYIEYKYNNGRRVHQISSVTGSDYLMELLQAAATGLTIHQLKSLLVSEDVQEEEAIGFVDELLQAQLLISELEPAVSGPEFIHQLLATLKKYSVEDDATISSVIRILHQANDLVNQLDQSTGNKAEAYRKVLALLDHLKVPYEENKLFQTDVAHGVQENAINQSIQEQLAESLDVLNKLTPFQENENLQSFVQRFYNRYEDKEMPLLEVLDTETGIGYLDKAAGDISPLADDLIFPGKQSEQRIAWGKIENFWKEKIEDANKKGDSCIDISSKDMEGFTSNWKDLCPTLSVVFRILDGETNSIFLEHATGSSAANLLGRFAHADEDINQLVNDITATEQQREEDIIYAEIIHLPESRVGNVLLHPAFRSYEIPYMASASVDADHQLLVQDLYISVKNKRVILRSKKLDREVIPRLSTAHNYTANALPVYQFLCDLQTQGKRSGVRFNWGSLKLHNQFLPRVTYNNTILHLATWQFYKTDVDFLAGIAPAVGLQEIKVFSEKWKLPRYVVLADADNELLIDFENEILVQNFLDIIKKRSSFTLKEFFYQENGCITDENNASYANQLIAVLVKKSSSYQTSKKVLVDASVIRKFTVGSEWVYFKLYCGVKSADKILLEAIKPLTEELLAQDVINKWFFIRYTDPDFHLRLRLHVKEVSKIGEVLNKIHTCLAPYEAGGYVWKVQMDTYNRELERYGSNTIGAAETFFYYDSIALLKMLDNTFGDERENVRWLWGLRSVDTLLDCFQFTLAEKLALLTHLKTAFANEFNMDKLLKVQLDAKHRANRKSIDTIMDAALDKEHDYYPLIQILEEKSDLLKDTFAILLTMQQNEQLSVTLTDLASHYIHMLLNRLYTSAQRLHEMITYDFLFRYYQSSVARQKKVPATEKKLSISKTSQA